MKYSVKARNITFSKENAIVKLGKIRFFLSLFGKMDFYFILAYLS